MALRFPVVRRINKATVFFIQRNEPMQSSDAFGTVSNPLTSEMEVSRQEETSDNGRVKAANKNSTARNDHERKRLAVELANFEVMAKEAREKLVVDGDDASRAAQVYQVAQQLFAAAPTWMAFYREILSLNGVAHILFPSHNHRRFEATEEFCEIQKMITILRAGSLPENDPLESQRMITVRLPLSLHKALCQEAEVRGVSVNQLCISRLLNSIDDEYIPNSLKGRRGRRPGPQGPRRDCDAKSEDVSVMESKVGRFEERESE